MPRNATHVFDGLTKGYGTHTVDNDIASVTAEGDTVTIKMEIILADVLGTAALGSVLSPQAVIIPRGAYFRDATLQTVVAATSGGAATLDIGTFSRGLDTEIVDDEDGLVADVTIAEMTSVGEIHVLDGAFLPIASGVTGFAGAVSNSDVVIVPSFETAVFTAGVVLLTVRYNKPFGSAGRTLAV